MKRHYTILWKGTQTPDGLTRQLPFRDRLMAWRKGHPETPGPFVLPGMSVGTEL